MRTRNAREQDFLQARDLPVELDAGHSSIIWILTKTTDA